MGPELLIPIGCLVYVVALISLWGLHLQAWRLVLAMSIGGLGSGLTFNAIPWLLVRAIPPEETASVMSVNLVLRFVGFAMGSVLAIAWVSGFGGSPTSPTRQGFEAATLVGAGICLFAAVVSWVLMKGPSPVGVDYRSSPSAATVTTKRLLK